MATTRLRQFRRRMSLRKVTGAAPVIVLVIALLATARAADAPDHPGAQLFLDVAEVTDLAVSSAATGGPLVAGMYGRIWRIPAEGGAALALTRPELRTAWPRVSPDGKRVAYEVRQGSVSHLALLDLTSGEAQDLTTGAARDSTPAWLPDGEHLLMASNRGGDFAIWELDLRQGTLTQLTAEPGDALEPAADGTGRRIAYVTRGGRTDGLYVLDAGRSSPTLVMAGAALHAPSWRPDGTVITYVARNGEATPQLRMAILSDPPVSKAVERSDAAAFPANWLGRGQLLYGADGRVRRREFGALTATDVPFSARLAVTARGPVAPRSLPADDASPAPAPQGFGVLPDGEVIAAFRGDLWRLPADGGAPVALTRDAAIDTDPAVAPDGRSVAFVSDRDGTSQVWLLEPAGGEPRRLTAEPAGVAHPVFSPGADRIAYLAGTAGDAWSLRAVALPSGKPVTLAEDLDGRHAPGFSPDGRYVAIAQPATPASDPAALAHLLLVPAAGDGRPRRMTLVREALAGGPNQLAYAPDGGRIAIASPAGVTVVPVSAEGIVAPSWQRTDSRPAAAVAWSRDGTTLWVGGGAGLRRVPAAGGAGAAVAVSLPRVPASSAARHVIRAERVFDGQGYLYRREIVIENHRIVELRPWSDETTDVVDARGRTVIPGLIDALLPLRGSAPPRLGELLLACGVTTVQVTTGDTATAAAVAALAQAWRSHAAGPRAVLTADDALPAGGRSEVPPEWSADWLAAFRGEADAITPGSTPVSMRQDGVAVLARTGVPFLPPVLARAAPLLVEERPELLRHPALLRYWPAAATDALAASWRSALQQNGATLRRLLQADRRTAAAISAGGGVIVTASGRSEVPPGLSLQAAAALLAGGGLPHPELINTLTANPARLLGFGGELGRIAPGYRADLVILDGDPLKDAADLLRVRQVILDGEVLPPADDAAGPALEKFTAPPHKAEVTRSAARGSHRHRGVVGPRRRASKKLTD